MHRRVCITATAVVLALCTRAAAQEIPSPLDRDTVIALAAERNPTVRAMHERSLATQRRADAEGKLPSPELDLEVWQIPFSDRQGMIMAGFRQRFPSLGLALGSRADSVRAEAKTVEIESSDAAREVRKRAAHAFADYLEASERVRLHAAHIELGRRIAAAAQVRVQAGGPLTDVAQADVDLAMVVVEHQEARVNREGARAEIDTLLLRPIDAPLPDPVVPVAMAPAWSVGRIVEEAIARRPEIARARAVADADEARRVAAKREWLVPSVSVAALYFAPVGATNQNGVGVSLAVELPWLWGEKGARADAAKLDREASETIVAGARVDVAAEVAAAWRAAAAAALKVRSYDDQVLPASRRAFDIAFAGYTTARTDLPVLLLASRAIVDAEIARLVAATSLEHALADLDAAAGFVVPRQPLAQWSAP